MAEDAVLEAFWYVDQTLQMVEDVVTQEDVTVEELAAVGRLSYAAMDALASVLRPFMEDAREYYLWRSMARVCCQYGHPVLSWAQAFNALQRRFLSVHGDLTTRHLALTGE